MWWENLREIPISDFRSVMRKSLIFTIRTPHIRVLLIFHTLSVNHWCFNWSRWAVYFVFFWVDPFHLNIDARTNRVLCNMLNYDFLSDVGFIRYSLRNITFLCSLSEIDRKRMFEIGSIHLSGNSENQNLDEWIS